MAHNFAGFGLSGNVDDNPDVYREFCRRENELLMSVEPSLESRLLEVLNTLIADSKVGEVA